MMKALRKRHLASLILCLIVCFASAEGEQVQKLYFGTSLKDVVFGYTEVCLSHKTKEGKPFIQIDKKSVSHLNILGQDVEAHVVQVLHVDPESGEYFYQDSDITQGTTKLGSTVSVEGDTIHYVSKAGGEPKTLELLPGLIFDNSVYSPYLVKDFSGDVPVGVKKEYMVFDAIKGRPNTVTYTKKGIEKLHLAGKEFDTIMLDSFNKDTGVSFRVWIDSLKGLSLKALLANNVSVFLSDSSIIEEVKKAALDEILFAKVGVVIADGQLISYMKTRAHIVSMGEGISAESLNVPGQKFTGIVEENVIDGVFEVEYERYDGQDAPPFPHDYSGDASLEKFLKQEDLIESDDPVLVEKAEELTRGAAGSWDAAKRLSKWVAEEIGYGIPGGISARNTYDLRNGECGAHSRLLTALCRAVGIPARIVTGCMYTTYYGGSFGQHVWNEIYMGEAGWIPVDSTAKEIDYVDSGHIRLGLETGFNPKKMEILDYKAGEMEMGKTAAAAPEAYQPYIGEYRGREKPFKVMYQNGKLVLDIPDQIVVPLNEPDEEGIWYLAVAPHVGVSFSQDESGRVKSMTIHEIVRFLRSEEEVGSLDDVPGEFRTYVGKYVLAAANLELPVLYQEGTLIIKDPQSGPVKLKGPDEKGIWTDEFGKNLINFEMDADGKATALVIHSRSTLPKK